VKIASYKMTWANGAGSILQSWGEGDNIGGTYNEEGEWRV